MLEKTEETKGVMRSHKSKDGKYNVRKARRNQRGNEKP